MWDGGRMFGREAASKPLLVVGSINADLVVNVPRLPKPGETIQGSALHVYAGGKVRSGEERAGRVGWRSSDRLRVTSPQMQTRLFMAPTPLFPHPPRPLLSTGSQPSGRGRPPGLPHLFSSAGEDVGARPRAFRCLRNIDALCRRSHLSFPLLQAGQDAYASLLQTSLTAAGVDTSLVSFAPGPSGTALVLLQPGGENSIVVVGGANTSEDWVLTDAATSAIQRAAAVLLQREIPDVVNLIFSKLASAAGVPVLMDAGGAEAALDPSFLSTLALLSPNETELARLTGLPTRTEEQVLKAAQALGAQGVDRVLVKRGADGCLLWDARAQTCTVQRAAHVPRVVDTTGAGDCFTAAFAVAQVRGMADQDALRFASALGYWVGERQSGGRKMLLCSLA